MDDITETRFAADLIAEVAMELQQAQLTPPAWESISGIDDQVVAAMIVDTIENAILANHTALTSMGQDASIAFIVGAELVSGTLKKLMLHNSALGLATTNESIKRIKASEKNDINRN